MREITDGHIKVMLSLIEDAISKNRKEISIEDCQRFLSIGNCSDLVFDKIKEIIDGGKGPKLRLILEDTEFGKDLSEVFDKKRLLLSDQVKREIKHSAIGYFSIFLNNYCLRDTVSFLSDRNLFEENVPFEYKKRGLLIADPWTFLGVVKELEGLLRKKDYEKITPLVTRWPDKNLRSDELYFLCAHFSENGYLISGGKRNLYDFWPKGCWFVGLKKF
jgi:hypothetical protein